MGYELFFLSAQDFELDLLFNHFIQQSLQQIWPQTFDTHNGDEVCD